MATNDALNPKTVDDAKNAKPNDSAAANHILDDIYEIKKRDQADLSKLKSDFDKLSAKLHDEGFLPGLVICDSTADTVAVTGADGTVRTIASAAFVPTGSGDSDSPESAHGGSDGIGTHGTDGPFDPLDPKNRIVQDRFGRITDITNGDGSTTHIDYDGLNKSADKITTTKKDGSIVTYEKTGSNWTETTEAADGSPALTNNIDYATVSDSGDITVAAGSVKQVFHSNGSVDVTAQNGDNGPKTTAHYQYDSNGEISSVSRTNPDGTTDTFSINKVGQWQMKSYSADNQNFDTAAISNLSINPDGGVSYDTADTHVRIEGYGATHISETTSYGTYEQAFDPSGKLTLVARIDNTTGKTELISYINGSQGTLLVYDTNAPEGCSTLDAKINSDGSYSYVDESGAVINRGNDLSTDALKQTPLDPQISGAAKDNGVNVTRTIVDGKFQYEYSIEVAGEHVTLLTSDGPAEADNEKLQQMRDQKLAEVEQDDGVRFGRDGETTDVDHEQIPLKTPNLGQIYGVEASLVRSLPDVVTADGKPLEIDFTAVQGSNPSKGGFADGSRVVIEPNGGENTPDQVQKVLMHELAHNGQHRLYGDDKTFETNYAGQLGYVKAGNDWLLITKDGRYFKSLPGENGVGSSGWERCDKDGNPIDETGNPSDHPQIITNVEARNLALVKPATTYFPNPAEAGAEATSKFRSGEYSRSDLLAENPDTYAVIKRADQLDINKTYGLDANGQPNYIRNPDGIVVPNTAENRAAVKEFEDSVTNDGGGGLGSIFDQLNNSQQKISPKLSPAVSLPAGIEFAPVLTGAV